MAAVRKKGRIWYYRFTDADGVQRERPGCTDKRETEAMQANARAEAAKIRDGYVTAKDAACRSCESAPLTDHIAEWQADLVARGSTPKHAEHTSNRVRRLVAVILGSQAALTDHRKLAPKDRGHVARKIADAIALARLSSLTREKVQDAIARLMAAGWSLQTCNHYRASIKAFSKWCYDSDRTREDAGIPYCDASGLFFDFHSLRCQTATLADAAGVSPRVVQKLMRHSSLELTGRYTRPRTVDIEAAAGMLPTLKPEGSRPEALAATGTDGQPISEDFSLLLPYSGDESGRNRADQGVIADSNVPASMMRSTLGIMAPGESERVHTEAVGERRRPDSNRGIKVLQTSALPLGYGAAVQVVSRIPA